MDKTVTDRSKELHRYKVAVAHKGNSRVLLLIIYATYWVIKEDYNMLGLTGLQRVTGSARHLFRRDWNDGTVFCFVELGLGESLDSSGPLMCHVLSSLIV